MRKLSVKRRSSRRKRRQHAVTWEDQVKDKELTWEDDVTDEENTIEDRFKDKEFTMEVDVTDEEVKCQEVIFDDEVKDQEVTLEDGVTAQEDEDVPEDWRPDFIPREDEAMASSLQPDVVTESLTSLTSLDKEEDDDLDRASLEEFSDDEEIKMITRYRSGKRLIYVLDL